MKRRILVTGSRNWDNEDLIALELGRAVGELMREYPGDQIIVVHGAAKGADTIAARLADAHGISTEAHRAVWELWGKRAGIRRNEEMVAMGADICLAFIADGSSGSSHCAAYAEDHGIPVRYFRVSKLGQENSDGNATHLR